MNHDVSFLDDLDVDGEVSTSAGTLSSHAEDWGTPEGEGVTPDAVVYPASTADVSTVLAAANDRGVPVTPYAAGTGLERNAVPVEAGISMDLTRMDTVLDVRPEDFQIDVQPGVMGSTVDDRAGERGLWFPPLPSSGDISTVGGMIATDAGGMGTVKYGEVSDWVVRLEVVLADGTVVDTGTRAIKSSAGYNLTELVVGSEGTLGVVTEATLELDGRPRQIRGGRAVFPDLERATAAVTDAVQSGVDLAKVELVDETSARMANAYTGTDLPDAPMVFVEFHADHGVAEEVQYCREVFDAHDPLRFEVAADGEGMSELWQARRDLAFAMRSYDPDLTPLHPGDVTVPISEYGAMVRYAKDLAAERDVLVPCFGHAGDGNVHYSVLVDDADPGAVERGEDVYRRIVERAIEFDGTSTGEHGVGRGKREYLELERGTGALDAMGRVKRVFDPEGILNPGKIFPED